MKFFCNRDDISNAVASAQKAVSNKSNMPILEGIDINAEDDRIVLFGTDNEIGIECTFPARVEKAGEAVVNAKLFGDIVRNLPDETVCVEIIDDVNIRISSGDAVFVLFIIQTDAFPAFPEIERTRTYAIDQFILKQMLTQTSFAIGTDESRKTLTGLFLESDGGELRAVAVDGFRIALRKQPVERADNEIKMIIPSRTISELLKIIPSAAGELRLYGAENQAVVEFGNCRVHTRVINGEFFNYRYILPNEYMTQIIVNRQLLQGAIERAALIISSEYAKRYPIMLNVTDDAISVRALTNVGNAMDIISVDMQGEPIEVAFNPRYLIETLRAIDDELIAMRFTTRVGQCVIRPVDSDGYIYLILPVKVGD